MSNAKEQVKESAPVGRQRQSVDSTFAEKWTPEKEGECLEGVYLGYEEAPGRKAGELFNAYQILTDKEGKRSVAGAHLDSFMPQVPKGTYVWITYKGKRRLGNGDMQLFSVDVEKGTKLIDVMK